MLSKSLVVLASLAGLISCQNSTSFDASTVDQSTKEYWCQSQTSSCPLLCLQTPGATDDPRTNDCDADTLIYNCVCSNGLSPNASQYSLTIPYYICTAENNQCVVNCNGDSSCQSACRTDNPCGAQNPKRVNTTTSASATATNSVSATDTSSVGATATSGSNKGAAPRAMAVDLGQVYGLSILLGGFFARFAAFL